MSNTVQPKTTEQLMAEADELIRQINSDYLHEMDEDHRKQFELHTQNLSSIKAEAKDSAEHKEAFKISSSFEGVHEAIQGMVKAMNDLKNHRF